jgi:hypothetical protein
VTEGDNDLKLPEPPSSLPRNWKHPSCKILYEQARSQSLARCQWLPTVLEACYIDLRYETRRGHTQNSLNGRVMPLIIFRRCRQTSCQSVRLVSNDTKLVYVTCLSLMVSFELIDDKMARLSIAVPVFQDSFLVTMGGVAHGSLIFNVTCHQNSESSVYNCERNNLAES